jgi:hypothetical protein
MNFTSSGYSKEENNGGGSFHEKFKGICGKHSRAAEKGRRQFSPSR